MLNSADLRFRRRWAKLIVCFLLRGSNILHANIKIGYPEQFNANC